jgi:hypothetical protein
MPTPVLINLLNLLHSIPLEQLSARQILDLGNSLDRLGVRENLASAIDLHITRTAAQICGVAVPDRSPVVDVFRLVRRYHNQALMTIALRNIVKGHWEAKLDRDSWTAPERRDVGGVWDVLKYLSQVAPDGFKSSAKYLVTCSIRKSIPLWLVCSAN